MAGKRIQKHLIQYRKKHIASAKFDWKNFPFFVQLEIVNETNSVQSNTDTLQSMMLDKFFASQSVW